MQKPPSIKVCSKNKCVEGSVKNGVVVTFNDRRKGNNEKKYSECDRCRIYKNEISNPLVKIYLNIRESSLPLPNYLPCCSGLIWVDSDWGKDAFNIIHSWGDVVARSILFTDHFG